MRNNLKYVVGTCLLFAAALFAAPHNGDDWQLKQPDGSLVSVKVWGDEYYQRAETPDGYTLVRNAKGWICYAKQTSDGDLVPSGLIYRNGMSRKPPATLVKSIDRLPAKRRAMALAKKAELEAAPETMEYSSSSSSDVVGNIVGLTVLIDFSDNVATIPKERIDSVMNFVNYRGSMSSVRDFFYEVSSEKLTYTNIIAGYYRASNTMAYFDDPDASGRARELAREAILGIDPQVDFSQVTASNNTVLAVNILYAGRCTAGWAKGLWPHSGSMTAVTTAEGVRVSRYQMSGLGTGVSTGTIQHENGHMVCRWPDLYDYGGESRGCGSYDMMSSGGVIPNGYLRSRIGWDEPVDITNAPTGTLFRHVANSYTCFVYRNVSNTNEFFYIESRYRAGRLNRTPDSGLIIWHVDARGSNNNEQMTPEQHYLVSVEQADNQFHLENNAREGDGDLYHAGYETVFNDQTAPDAHWWDGSNSGLFIGNISRIGVEMTFTIGDGPVKIDYDQRKLNPLPESFSVLPQHSGLTVLCPAGWTGDMMMKVFDMRGRCVASTSWLSDAAARNKTIGWKSSAGCYLAVFQGRDRDGNSKLEKAGFTLAQ
ncbi:MAG: M6 family metalloprotease domain-containing protein [Chitinispirillaceae bacterium]|nr:M6 family metalloprotease domain-containing protein [Chitinispirillaceae bacterium]